MGKKKSTYQAKRGVDMGNIKLDADQLKFTPKDAEKESTAIPWDQITKHKTNKATSDKAMIKIVCKDETTVNFTLKNREVLNNLQEDIAKRIETPGKEAEGEDNQRPKADTGEVNEKKTKKKSKANQKPVTDTEEETQKLLPDTEDDDEKVLKATGWSHPEIPDAKKAHYAVTGNEAQVLTIGLPVGDSCKGEPGCMMYFTNGIKQNAACEGCWARCCAGEDCCVVNYTNEGGGGEEAYVALTPNFPTSKIIPIDMSSTDVNGALISQQGAFMASHGDVEVGMDCDCNLKRCCCGGMGLIRQKLSGSGTVFLESTGTIVQKILKEGETIAVDTNCVLAFAASCKLEIKRAGNVVGMLGGGEGIFNTTLTGPGLVVVQSMNQMVFLQSLVALKIYRR